MTERRTSAAKDILLPHEKALLETYGVMTNHFEHARDPMISEQHKDMAYRQELDKAREERGSILSNGGERLPQHHEPDRANDNQPDQAGSKMVKDDRPKQDMRPPEQFAKATDREVFDQKWYEEQLRADAREQERERAPDREPDREP